MYTYSYIHTYEQREHFATYAYNDAKTEPDDTKESFKHNGSYIRGIIIHARTDYAGAWSDANSTTVRIAWRATRDLKFAKQNEQSFASYRRNNTRKLSN